jgi:hypothetical protein
MSILNFIRTNITKIYIAYLLIGICINTMAFYKLVDPVMQQRGTESNFEVMKRNNENYNKTCQSNADCPPNSFCQQVGPVIWECQCNSGWVDYNGGSCNYNQKSKLVAFLVSFFAGEFGADWFYLCSNNGYTNAGYVVAGVFKLLSAGCLMVWWLVDWIRILCNVFPDGNMMPLQNW